MYRVAHNNKGKLTISSQRLFLTTVYFLINLSIPKLDFRAHARHVSIVKVTTFTKPQGVQGQFERRKQVLAFITQSADHQQVKARALEMRLV